MANNELEESLKRNIKSFKNSADLIYAQEDFTSATVLYFKALFSVLDFIILKEKGLISKDHSERFRILEKDFPNYYEIIDKYFSIYQESYKKSIEKEVCDKVKENVERLIKEQEI